MDWVNFFRDAGLQAQYAPRYAITFAENRIKPDMLADLNMEYLKEMGIGAMGDMIAILKHAKKVSQGQELIQEKADVTPAVVSSSSIDPPVDRPHLDQINLAAPARDKQPSTKSKIAPAPNLTVEEEAEDCEYLELGTGTDEFARDTRETAVTTPAPEGEGQFLFVAKPKPVEANLLRRNKEPEAIDQQQCRLPLTKSTPKRKLSGECADWSDSDSRVHRQVNDTVEVKSSRVSRRRDAFPSPERSPDRDDERPRVKSRVEIVQSPPLKQPQSKSSTSNSSSQRPSSSSSSDNGSRPKSGPRYSYHQEHDHDDYDYEYEERSASKTKTEHNRYGQSQGRSNSRNSDRSGSGNGSFDRDRSRDFRDHTRERERDRASGGPGPGSSSSSSRPHDYDYDLPKPKWSLNGFANSDSARSYANRNSKYAAYGKDIPLGDSRFEPSEYDHDRDRDRGREYAGSSRSYSHADRDRDRSPPRPSRSSHDHGRMHSPQSIARHSDMARYDDREMGVPPPCGSAPLYETLDSRYKCKSDKISRNYDGPKKLRPSFFL